MADTAKRQVSYTRRSFGEMVDRAEPRRLTDPIPAFILPNGRTKLERPLQPGKDYPWTKELPDV